MAGPFLLDSDGNPLLLVGGDGALLLSGSSVRPFVGGIGGAPIGALSIGAIAAPVEDTVVTIDPFDAIGDEMAQDLIHLVYVEAVTPVS